MRNSVIHIGHGCKETPMSHIVSSERTSRLPACYMVLVSQISGINSSAVLNASESIKNNLSNGTCVSALSVCILL